MTQVNKHLLHNSIDNVILLNIVTTLYLEFSHDFDDKVGQFLIFIKADLHFLGLTTSHRCTLDSSCSASNCRLAWIDCLSLGLLHLFLLLPFIIDPFLVSLLVDIFLKLLELDIILLDIDITVSQKTADLTDVEGLDGIIAVSSRHCLRETNQRL